jgi:hypothetical protein
MKKVPKRFFEFSFNKLKRLMITEDASKGGPPFVPDWKLGKRERGGRKGEERERERKWKDCSVSFGIRKGR